MLKRNVQRDREILAAFEAGRSVESLCDQYGLSDSRLRRVLTDERNNRRVSPEPFYRAIRAASSIMLGE
jgi:Mor family transcriptional regulator